MTGTRAWSAALVAGGLLAGGLAAGPVAATAAEPSGGAAPGAPGQEADYTPANKTGYGTSHTTASTVWFTLQDGRMSEVYYPDISTPATRTLELVVTDGHSFTVRDRDARVRTTRVSADSPTFRQVVTDRRGRWRLVKTYVTDPARPSVVMHVRFRSLTGHPYHVYAFFDPDLTGNGNDDTAHSRRHALTAHDAETASAVTSRRGFTATSSGFLGTSDGWTDLRSDHRMDWHYRVAP